MNRLREQAIDELVKACISKGQIGNAREAAKLGASQQAIDELVKACISEGRTGDAREAAKLGGRELTQQEIIDLTEVVRS